MTDREKQIEEMSLSMLKWAKLNQKCCDTKGAYSLGEYLINMNYRKMDEIALKLDLGDRSAEEIQQIAEMFNKAMANEKPLVTISSNEEEIAKRVAKEILQDWYDDVVHGMGAEGHYIFEYAKKYGVEIEE